MLLSSARAVARSVARPGGWRSFWSDRWGSGAPGSGPAQAGSKVAHHRTRHLFIPSRPFIPSAHSLGALIVSPGPWAGHPGLGRHGGHGTSGSEQQRPHRSQIATTIWRQRSSTPYELINVTIIISLHNITRTVEGARTGLQKKRFSKWLFLSKKRQETRLGAPTAPGRAKGASVNEQQDSESEPRGCNPPAAVSQPS